MSLEKMADIVIDWIKKSGGSALIIMDACQKGKLEQAYKLITETPKMTLDQFTKKMEITEE